MFSFRLVRFTFDFAKVRKKNDKCKYFGINLPNSCHFSVIHYVNVRFCSCFECRSSTILSPYTRSKVAPFPIRSRFVSDPLPNLS